MFFMFCVLFLSFAIASSGIEVARLPQTIIDARLDEVAEKNVDRSERLYELFREAGCGDQLLREKVRGSKLPNIVCTLPGNGEHTIVVGAHYDKVSAGAGAIDNWSGAALLPSLYEGLKSVGRRFTLVFVEFTDEEKGLIGSRHHARLAHKERRGQTWAMINMDTLGTTEVAVWAHQADPALFEWLNILSVQVKIPFQLIDVQAVGNTDSSSFKARKIPTITFHSLTQPLLTVIHSDDDRLERIDRKAYYDSYRLILMYLAWLDEV